MINSAIPNSQGISRTNPSIDWVSSPIFPCRNVSPIQAIPKIAITACIPAGKTEPCVAFKPSVLVNRRISAAADNITISMMDDIPNVTISPSIRKEGDLAALALASYIAELACELAPPEEPAKEYLRLLLNTLHLAVTHKRPLLQSKAAFELRLLAMAGFMPDLIGCTCCGEYDGERPMYFSPGAGTITCQDCGKESPGSGGLVSPGVLAAMRHILYSPFEKIFSFSLSEDGISELSQVVEGYLRYHLQRSWRSLDFFYSVL